MKLGENVGEGLLLVGLGLIIWTVWIGYGWLAGAFALGLLLAVGGLLIAILGNIGR